MIKSILDTDLYKLTMQQAVLNYKPNATARYVFNNRRLEGRFNKTFEYKLKEALVDISKLKINEDEINFLKLNCPYLSETYLEYLKNFNFDPKEVQFEVKDGELNLEIYGKWSRTILWEVPLMAQISELYFQICDTNWNFGNQENLIKEKAKKLQGCNYSEFGTRRRRSYYTQNFVVKTLKEFGCTTTSNVHFAHKFNLTPIGTMAHEWIMGVSAFEGVINANNNALRIWSEIYQGDLGIILPDTFTSDIFFKNWNKYYAHLYYGVRQDSGDPNKFAQKLIESYNKMGIDPKTKIIIFSDNLNVEKVLQLNNTWKDKINVRFGIGTHFTNDFQNSKALNMVIKLNQCDNVPVVKLSDDIEKAIGNTRALRVAKWILRIE